MTSDREISSKEDKHRCSKKIKSPCMWRHVKAVPRSGRVLTSAYVSEKPLLIREHLYLKMDEAETVL